VDYDGSQTNFESSTNYTLEEYAADVVYTSSRSATKRRAHPAIVSESGRAVVRLQQLPGVQRAGGRHAWRHQRPRGHQTDETRAAESSTCSTPNKGRQRAHTRSRATTNAQQAWRWR